MFVLIAALAAIPFFIDTQSLKTKLVTEAEGILHRRMSVQAVEITIFTGLGVRLNRAVIFDDLRFANAPFVSLNSVTVRPRLLPLLRGSVEVASIELEQPEIRLIQNQDRTWNFESIGAAAGRWCRQAGTGGCPARNLDWKAVAGIHNSAVGPQRWRCRHFRNGAVPRRSRNLATTISTSSCRISPQTRRARSTLACSFLRAPMRFS